MGLTQRSLVSHSLVKPQGLPRGHPQPGFCTACTTVAPSAPPRLGLWWMAVGAFWEQGSAATPHHVFSAQVLEAVRAVPRSASSTSLSLPPQTPKSLQALSSAVCGPTVLLNSDFSACTYSTHHLDTNPQQGEQPDNLLESSLLSSQMTPSPERDRLASSRARITVQDKLTASQCGYQCTSCCHVSPTLWLIQPELLGEQELKAQEAAAPRVSVQPRRVSVQPQQPSGCRGRALLHHSCQQQNGLV
uniref:Uncharacterized protein n=1 Tax=Malurus cyaneus samueli TaxID=2593467 RepID=A0A8C5X6X0_9PASS